MKCIQFTEGSVPSEDRWICKLPPEDGGEEIEFNFEGMRVYLLPDVDIDKTKQLLSQGVADTSAEPLCENTPLEAVEHTVTVSEDERQLPTLKELLQAQTNDPQFTFWFLFLQNDTIPNNNTWFYRILTT